MKQLTFLSNRRRNVAAAMMVTLAALVVIVDVAVSEARESTGTATPSASVAAPAAPASGRLHPTRTTTSPGTAGVVPAVAAAPAPSATSLRRIAVAAAKVVTPDIVDINTTLPGATGAGTGIVLTSTGEILTNNHVIDGASSITATDLSTGKTYPATVVGYDPGDDIAVLQLTGASGLPVAKLNTAAPRIGDSVIGVGNAEGRGGTPSWAAGSITAAGRTITATDENGSNPEHVTGLLQTTAPIQPGDSGGPLVDTAGKVIGMDTTGTFEGSSTTASSAFAIPISKALAVVAEMKSGHAPAGVHLGQTAALGVAIQAGKATASAGGNGVMISAATGSGPAAAAGLGAGDTITSVDGTAINSVSDLTAELLKHRPGDAVRIVWTTASGASHSATVHLINGAPQ